MDFRAEIEPQPRLRKPLRAPRMKFMLVFPRCAVLLLRRDRLATATYALAIPTVCAVADTVLCHEGDHRVREYFSDALYVHPWRGGLGLRGTRLFVRRRSRGAHLNTDCSSLLFYGYGKDCNQALQPVIDLVIEDNPCKAKSTC